MPIPVSSISTRTMPPAPPLLHAELLRLSDRRCGDRGNRGRGRGQAVLRAIVRRPLRQSLRSRGSDRDTASGGVELDRVVDKVQEDLLQAPPVGGYKRA